MPARRHIPDKISADWPTKLQAIPHPKQVGQIGRHLTVVESFDRQREAAVLGRRRNRVTSLRLITVLCGHAHVNVLASAMPGPPWDVENERAGP